MNIALHTLLGQQSWNSFHFHQPLNLRPISHCLIQMWKTFWPRSSGAFFVSVKVEKGKQLKLLIAESDLHSCFSLAHTFIYLLFFHLPTQPSSLQCQLQVSQFIFKLYFKL